ncbi:proline-alanine-rich protein [Persimmon latent virus]|uniref:Proline-alanine-rich protein n=1 Tax=Persimmon latent virus TaxID=1211481 RepID=R4X5Y4_9VIRU|nr:proline-alanine-rich protein [Persimmon latent virus]BAN29037.1 proline-alanine-rich protein [Persimmon latent virus]
MAQKTMATKAELDPPVGSGEGAQTLAMQAGAMLGPSSEGPSPAAQSQGQQSGAHFEASTCSPTDRTNSLSPGHPLLPRGVPVPAGGIQPHLAFMPHHAERPQEVVRIRRRHGRSLSPPSSGRFGGEPAPGPSPRAPQGTAPRRGPKSRAHYAARPQGSPSREGGEGGVDASVVGVGQIRADTVNGARANLLPPEDVPRNEASPVLTPLHESPPRTPSPPVLSESQQYAIHEGFVWVRDLSPSSGSDSDVLLVSESDLPKYEGELRSRLEQACRVATIYRRNVLGMTEESERQKIDIPYLPCPHGRVALPLHSEGQEELPPCAPSSPPAPSSSDSENSSEEERRSARSARRLNPSTPRSGLIDQRYTVKFGDHSIHTSDVSPDPIYSIRTIDGVSDFFSRGLQFVETMYDSFDVDAHSIRVTSQLVCADQPLCVSQAFPVRGEAFHSHNRNFTIADTTMAVVNFGPTRVKGRIDDALLTPYMIGGVPNSRSVSSAITPELRPANRNLILESASVMQSNLTYYDNSMLYAKLIWNALLIDVYAHVGLVPAVIPFEAERSVSWINLDDANLAVPALTVEFAKGSIMLLQDRDFTTAELQEVQWLSVFGRRFLAPANGPTPVSSYVNWPRVPICLLAHGAQPAALPACAMLTSARLLSFCAKLAASRGEWEDCLKGAYLAMDVLGTDYNITDNHAYPMNVFLGLENLRVPAPSDYNFFCRLLGLCPPADVARRDEFFSLMAASSANRVRGVSLYVASMRTFSTTTLHSLSIGTGNLVDWCTGAIPQGGVNMVLQSGIVNPQGDYNTESAMFEKPKAAFERFLGFRIEKGFYAGSNWMPACGSLAAALSYYSPLISEADAPPRKHSCLAIDDFLLMRPQEWGVLGGTTQIDFHQDLVAFSTPENRGVFSDRGDATYRQRLTSPTPYLFVPYGIQLLNAVCQHFEVAEHVPYYRGAVYNGGAESSFSTTPARFPSSAWIEDLSMFEPCALTSFSWIDHTVRAPCMVGAVRMTASMLRALQMWRGATIPKTGCPLARIPGFALQGLAPPPFAGMGGLGAIGGVVGGGAADGADTPNQPSGNG